MGQRAGSGLVGRLVALVAAGAVVASLLPVMAAGQPAGGGVAGEHPELLGLPEACDGMDEDPFDDVDPEGTHGPGIACVAHLGITLGTQPGLYEPDQQVLRDQMATFLARLIGETGLRELPDAGQVAFADEGDERTEVHRENAERLAEAGIVDGVDEVNGQPVYGFLAPVNRAAMASFLIRSAEWAAETELELGADHPFDDVDADDTHAENIGKAWRAGVTGGVTADTYDQWAGLTREQMATFLSRTFTLLEEDDPFVGELPEGVTVAPSVEQVYLYGAEPGQAAYLLDDAGQVVENTLWEWHNGDRVVHTGGQATDDKGGIIFRGEWDIASGFSGIDAGEEYTVRLCDEGAGVEHESCLESAPLPVMGPDEHPEQGFYDARQLPVNPDGGQAYGYLETRDGTELSVYTILPGPPEEGPYPTLIEYSGYDPSNPDLLGSLVEGDLAGQAGTLVGAALGYATVSVNMRGSGCSGGGFDYFEELQNLDGYDMVETVGAQDWSANIGMIGISYPGISQLFTAGTQPPSLDAISPIAVIGDHGLDTVAPGGIFNTGFAQGWAESREHDTRFPNGQAWVDQMVESLEDDEVERPASDFTTEADAVQCAENVELRDQGLPLWERVEEAEFRTDMWATRAPADFADEIDASVHMVNSWQDEQTGGRAHTMLDRFDLEAFNDPADPDTPAFRYYGVNGTHMEGLSPEPLGALVEFLAFEVREEVPELPDEIDIPGVPLPFDTLEQIMNFAYGEILQPEDDFGAELELPDYSQYDGMDFADARQAWVEQEPVRILFEQGASERYGDGFPSPAFQGWFAADEVPDVASMLDEGAFDDEISTWHLTPDGELVRDDDFVDDLDEQDATTYEFNPDAYNVNNWPDPDGTGSSGMWRMEPTGYGWDQLPQDDLEDPLEQSFASFMTEPLEDDVVTLGTGSVDLWIDADADDVDLEVTLTEITPGGDERYVKNGWLRASRRHLDEDRSGPLRPVPSHLEADSQSLTEDEWELVRVEIFPHAHVFRADSQIRLTVEAPGGNRPLWEFEDLVDADGTPEVRIAHHIDDDPFTAPEFASRVVLPVVDADVFDAAVDRPVGQDFDQMPGMPTCDPDHADFPNFSALRGQPCRDAPGLLL